MENNNIFNGTYNYPDYAGETSSRLWGVVENTNHRTGLCDVFFPKSPEGEERRGHVAIHELLSWITGGILIKEAGAS